MEERKAKAAAFDQAMGLLVRCDECYPKNNYYSCAQFALEGLNISANMLDSEGNKLGCVFAGNFIGSVAHLMSFGDELLPDDFEGRAHSKFAALSESKDATMLLRSLAMFSRALPLAGCGHYSREANYSRRALSYASKVPDSAFDDEMDEFLCGTAVYKLNLRRGFLQKELPSMKERLHYLEGPPNFGAPLSSLNVNNCLHYYASTGGGHCCGCGKTPEEKGMVSLLKCNRCRLAHYCSEACQASCWPTHMAHCKKWKHFKKGDAVILEGLRKRPSLNGSFATLVEKVEGNSKGGDIRWTVSLPFGNGGSKSISVKMENLRHLRPVA